ncbi:MAG: hypothetical protein EOQ86_19375 [Mesorhizobium sp.]|nr:MAG: hypothetical protein EOQ86_19375 [Mesorhizobium sp.]RWH88815.1 MAG: hypothetical protein EOQ87_20700 [Mesorhizobium sp.]RWH95673.1 MAG: hypothetical protein EOQ88_22835 [Mesorhizobium sp.]RWI11841.1 MAG: hypothetical protein EOQ91_31090 [Mesorhizobium sp.]RWM34237.1 MAG: hypothetical protein EOR77_14635 [Mesorhizobium sp.]
MLQNAIGASANSAATFAMPVHDAQIAVIISHISHRSWRRAAFWFMLAAARGETGGVSPLSQLSGIVSLFLIAAAFLTSCDTQQPQQGTVELSTLAAE